MSGTGTPIWPSRSLMCGTAAAASSRSTVMRTSSEPAARQRRDLPRGPIDVGGVGIGHRLHDDRRAAADHHAADIHRYRSVTLRQCHSQSLRAPELPAQYGTPDCAATTRTLFVRVGIS